MSRNKITPPCFQNQMEIIDFIIRQGATSVAFLGYTDLMMTDMEWSYFVSKDKPLVSRPNTEKLKSIHGRHDVNICPTIASVFSSIYGEKVSVDVFDFTKYEGNEIEHDFNYEIPREHIGKYDVIFDFGTCEHIFNLPQTLFNCHLMLKDGGFVYHSGPLCWPNHGFYGYNPTLFADFYSANCSEVQFMNLSTKYAGRNKQMTAYVESIPYYDRFSLAELFKSDEKWLRHEFNLNVLVKKLSSSDKITYPIQHKYTNKDDWR